MELEVDEHGRLVSELDHEIGPARGERGESDLVGGRFSGESGEPATLGGVRVERNAEGVGRWANGRLRLGLQLDRADQVGHGGDVVAAHVLPYAHRYLR